MILKNIFVYSIQFFVGVNLLWVSYLQAKTGDNNGYYLSSGLLLSYSKISEVEFEGEFNEPDPVYFYTDQDHDPSKESTYDLVGGANIQAGYDFGRWRAELDYGYRFRFDLNGDLGLPDESINYKNNVWGHINADINSQTLMLNLLYAYPFDDDFNLFIGAGVGRVRNETEVWIRYRRTYVYYETTDWETTWQLKGGVEYLWHDNWQAIVSLGFVELGELDFGESPQNAFYQVDEYTSIELALNLKYLF